MPPIPNETTGLAAEIRAELARQNLTRTDLAHRTGLSHSCITRKLAGTRDITTTEIARIAHALGITASTLIARTEAN